MTAVRDSAWHFRCSCGGPLDVKAGRACSRCDGSPGDSTPQLTPRNYLDCSICGSEAIESADGWFSEDDGERCDSCGHPGHVATDGEGRAWWWTDDDCTAECTHDD